MHLASFQEQLRASLTLKTIQFCGEIVHDVQVWHFFCEPINQNKKVEFNAKQAKQAVAEKWPVVLILVRKNLHGSQTGGVVEFLMWSEVWIWVQHEQCLLKKQILQLVVMGTKCMMLTCFHKITSRKCSCGRNFSKRGSISFTKIAG